MISADVPKDLSRVKNKVVFNLTLRQLICFSLAGIIGIPFYLLFKEVIDSGVAAILMVTLMLPFFLLAMYEKDGIHFEQLIGNILKQKFINRSIRIYQTENSMNEENFLMREEEISAKRGEKSKPKSKASGNRKKKQKRTQKISSTKTR